MNSIKNVPDSYNNLPTTFGIYIYKSDGVPIYIGKSINIKTRVKSHFEASRLDKKERAIVEQADTIEWILTTSEFEALVLEAELIKEHKPKYNRIWMDDKSYLYIKIPTSDTYPKITLVRKNEKLDKKSLYFGPFGNSQTAKKLLKLIRRIIPYCSASKIGKSPCFYHKIGLCNPCPNVIEQVTDENIKKELQKTYKDNIKTIIKMLEGGLGDIVNTTKKNITAYSAEENYEAALKERMILEHIEELLSERFMTRGIERDRIEYGVKSTDTEELLQLLRPFYPNLAKLDRMECYDASHLQGEGGTVSMVVMTNGVINKKEYKKFKIRTNENSDFARLKEAFERRVKHSEWGEVDLYIVDGGVPQVRTIRKVFEELQITTPLIGIAKNPDRLVMNNEFFKTVRVSFNNRGFNLIRLLRDEAHRFSKAYSAILIKKRSL